MGLFALLPVAALVTLFLSGADPLAGEAALSAAASDPGFELLASGQSAVAALLLFAGVRLARGRRRRS